MTRRSREQNPTEHSDKLSEILPSQEDFCTVARSGHKAVVVLVYSKEIAGLTQACSLSLGTGGGDQAGRASLLLSWPNFKEAESSH